MNIVIIEVQNQCCSEDMKQFALFSQYLIQAVHNVCWISLKMFVIWKILTEKNR